LSVKRRLQVGQAVLERVSSDELKPTDLKLQWGDANWIAQQIHGLTREKIESFIIPSDPREKKKLEIAYRDYFEKKRNHLLRKGITYRSDQSKLDYFNRLLEHVDIEKHVASGDHLETFSEFRRFLWDYFEERVSKADAQNILTRAIRKFEQLLSKSQGEDLYAVGGTHENERYMTIRQEANYIAHCMVRGVDKSKIVPVYDWDGNLLWPREEDVIKEKPKEKEK